MRKTFFLLLILFTTVTAFAQVNDNFSDGDFIANPSWSGDVAKFKINSTAQLQLNDSIAENSYLSTPNAISLDDVEWSFYIKQSFAPSGSNYGRVYLASDQANLEGALNGYYLQFGEAGALDAVELFRQSGTTSTSVLRATDGKIASSFSIRVKVTRSASGLWSLYIDYLGGMSYTLEATGTELTYTSSVYFGVATVYTMSNSTKFYFDDFYAGPIIIDTTAPSITAVNVISPTQLDISFNETLEITSAEMFINYSVNNGIGNPSQAVRDAADFKLVHLTFASSFADGVLHTLTVSAIKDQSGNAIVTDSKTFTYAAPVVAGFKDVIITEIFPDPSPEVGLPPVEFVEIYNRSDKTLNLSGWSFSDPSTTGIINETIFLSPDEYLILCKAADTSVFKNIGKYTGLSSFPSLNNGGDNIYLKNKDGIIIDSVAYDIRWYNNTAKDDGGWTLELIYPDYNPNCPIQNNWSASIYPSGGTPGSKNSIYSAVADSAAPTVTSVTVIDSLHLKVCYNEELYSLPSSVIDNGIGSPASAILDSTLQCMNLVLSVPIEEGIYYTISTTNAGDCNGNLSGSTNSLFVDYTPKAFDLIINEIMTDPDPAVDLPEFEYIELYNRTKFPISIAGWRYTAGSNTKTIGDYTVQPNSFLILTSTTAASAFAGLTVAPVTSFPALTNSGQTLVLANPEGKIIHTVTYSDKWYNDENKSEGGWSLELINPSSPCEGSENWTASKATSGGTPGKVNSVYTLSAEEKMTELKRVTILSLTRIQVYLTEPADSSSLLTAAYSIDHSLSVNSIDPVGPAYESVILNLSTPLAQKIIYTLIVNGVAACSGASVNSSKTVRFALPETIAPGDIVINEVLANPAEGGFEFLEIYNRSSKVLDLKNIRVSSMDTITLQLESITSPSSEGYLIFPGEYILLSSDMNVVKKQYNIKNPEAFINTTIPSLNTEADAVVLSDSAGNIIDQLIYYEKWHFPLLNSTKGISLERIDYDRLTVDAGNWHSASEFAGFATPGYQNSQFSKAETGSEVTVSPSVFSPDNDGVDDVINISYSFSTPGFVANAAIYNSNGRLIKYLLRNELLGISGTFSWDGINEENQKALIGIYIIYLEIFNTSGVTRSFKKPFVLAGKL